MVKYTSGAQKEIDRMFAKFRTVHKKGSHLARCNGKEIVKSQPTEIDLVRALAKLGIDLSRYQSESIGDEIRLITFWYL